jgi:hypothetical protein
MQVRNAHDTLSNAHPPPANPACVGRAWVTSVPVERQPGQPWECLFQRASSAPPRSSLHGKRANDPWMRQGVQFVGTLYNRPTPARRNCGGHVILKFLRRRPVWIASRDRSARAKILPRRGSSDAYDTVQEGAQSPASLSVWTERGPRSGSPLPTQIRPFPVMSATLFQALAQSCSPTWGNDLRSRRVCMGPFDQAINSPTTVPSRTSLRPGSGSVLSTVSFLQVLGIPHMCHRPFF